jgi:hypothetical protein
MENTTEKLCLDQKLSQLETKLSKYKIPYLVKLCLVSVMIGLALSLSGDIIYHLFLRASGIIFISTGSFFVLSGCACAVLHILFLKKLTKKVKKPNND